MSRRLTAAVVLLGLVALAACSGRGPRTLPEPSGGASTVPQASTTTADFSTVPLERLPGETTTTLVTSGDAVLSGVVAGPEGNVPGAIVRAERLVGSAVQPFEVRAADDATWELRNLPGGRYRVRAYLPPELGMEEPVVTYLRNDESRDVALRVRTFTGIVVTSGTTPDIVFVGDAVSLAVRVTERFVDEDGIGRLRPIVDVPVRVRASGWEEADGNSGTTDEDGVVVFTFSCERATPVTATAVVGPDRQQYPLDVPDCQARPTTTTSSTTTTTDGTTTSSTSSTSATSTTSSTTTSTTTTTAGGTSTTTTTEAA